MGKYVKRFYRVGGTQFHFAPEVGEFVTLASSLAHHDRVGQSFEVKRRLSDESFELENRDGKVVAVLGQMHEPISDVQVKEIEGALKKAKIERRELLKDFRVSRLEGLPVSRYNEAIGYLANA